MESIYASENIGGTTARYMKTLNVRTRTTLLFCEEKKEQGGVYPNQIQM